MSNKKDIVDYYELLHLSRSADKKEIKKKYFELVKKYHPDVIEQLNPEEQNKIYLINEAYKTLVDDSLREKYDKDLEANTKSVHLDDKEAARKYFALGRKYMHEKEFSKAVKAFRKGLQYDGGNAQAWSILGKALSEMGNLHDAATCSKRAVEINDSSGELFANLAGIYEKAGMIHLAIKNYQMAAMWSPSNSSYRSKLNELKEKKECIEKPDGFMDKLKKFFKGK